MVQPRPAVLWPGPGIDPGAVESALVREGEAQREPARSLLAKSRFEPEVAVRLSIASQAIIEDAHRRNAQLIVMGMRGHGALGGFALGSVALRVAHRAPGFATPDVDLYPTTSFVPRFNISIDGRQSTTHSCDVSLATCAPII
ncbi:MAG TPA: universal stress protein [Burkholderiales bacterium]|nr:universal stress protein [Burkholderiales bacterium]